MQLSMGEVASLLGASCEAPGRLVSGYSIDSRSIASGSLFFAIRGRRFDGHQFVSQAPERGAVGAVVEQAFRERVSPTLVPMFILVADTTRARQDLCRAWGMTSAGQVGS